MLTQQQADDYNIWQHELEAIEIGQNMAQKQINSYVDAMSKVSDMMATATPEMMNRIRLVMPKLVEGYNNAKLKLSSYEDRHQQALSKVNEYKSLEAQQTVQQPRGRVIKSPSPTPTPSPNPTTIDENNPPITSIYEGIGRGSTPEGPKYLGGIQDVVETKPQQYMTPVTEATLPGWISTINGPRYVGQTVKTKPLKYMTPVEEATYPGWVSTVNGPRYLGY